MSSAIYSPGSGYNQNICVEINQPFVSTGVISTGVQSAQFTYVNALSQTIVVDISVPAPHTISAGGLNVTITANPAIPGPIPVTMVFGNNYSGKVLFTVDSLDNSGVGIDRLCGFNIGTPTISANAAIVGNCVQSIPNDIVSKVLEWSNVINQGTITFDYHRSVAAATVDITLGLEKRAIERWFSDGRKYKDPQTNLVYTALPTGVTFSKCEDENRYGYWTKEMCAELPPLAWEQFSATTWTPVDIYNQITPRVDGAPMLTGSIAAAWAMEFNKTGDKLYSLDGLGNIVTQGYDHVTGILTTESTTAVSAVYLPLTIGVLNMRGIAIDPTTDSDEIYVVHLQTAPNLVHILRVNPTTGIATHVGNTGIPWAITAPISEYDIVFALDGMLLYVHADTVHVLDPTTAQKVTDFKLTVNNGATAFTTGYATRTHSGDIIISGYDTLGPHLWTLDANNYSLKDEWSTTTSATPLTAWYVLANPNIFNISFTRVFREDVDTGEITYTDRDISGRELIFPINTKFINCQEDPGTTWTQDLCYRQDYLPRPLGDIAITPVGVLTAIGNCDPYAAFVPPVVVGSSFTHSPDGTRLYVLDTSGNLVTYNWATKSTPALLSSLAITGVPALHDLISIRMKWDNNTLWLHAQDTVTPTTHRFYTLNTGTGAATLQGYLLLPGTDPVGTNGTFTWGVDGKMYFYVLKETGATSTYGLYEVNRGLVSHTLTPLLATAYGAPGSRITTDVTSGLLATIGNTPDEVVFYDYSGKKVTTCVLGASIVDYIRVPEDRYILSRTYKKITKLYTKDKAGISATTIDSITGDVLNIPAGAILENCNSVVSQSDTGEARFQVLSGTVSWNKNTFAPNAKSITFTRISNAVSINDGVGTYTINSASTFTWTAEQINNNISFTGLAAGSSFAVAWIN